MRIVVTGATGNVGTSVVQALARRPRRGRDHRRSPAARPPGAPPKTRWVWADVERDDLSAHVRGRRRRHPPRLADPAQPRRPRARARQRRTARSKVFDDRRARGRRRRSSTPPRSASTRRGPKDRARRRVAPARRRPDARSTPATRRAPSAGSTRSRDELRIVRLRPGLIFKREAGPEIRRLFAGPLLPGAAAQAWTDPRAPAARPPVGAVRARQPTSPRPTGSRRRPTSTARSTSPPIRSWIPTRWPGR